MNYPLHTRTYNKNSRARTIAIMIGVFFLLVILSWTPVPSLLVGAGSSGFSSVWGGLSTSFTDKAELERENQELRLQLENLRAQERTALATSQAYQDLLQEQTLIDIEGTQTVPVISRPPYVPYDAYVIDVSRADSVEVNQLVLSDGKYVIGYIESIYEPYALVRLFSSSDLESVFSVEGFLYGAQGAGGGIIKISLPRNLRSSEGVRVRVPGVPNYIVGTIIDTKFDPQDSFVQGIVHMGPNVYADELVTLTTQKYVPQELVQETLTETNEEADSNTQ